VRIRERRQSRRRRPRSGTALILFRVRLRPVIKRKGGRAASLGSPSNPGRLGRGVDDRDNRVLVREGNAVDPLRAEVVLAVLRIPEGRNGEVEAGTRLDGDGDIRASREGDFGAAGSDTERASGSGETVEGLSGFPEGRAEEVGFEGIETSELADNTGADNGSVTDRILLSNRVVADQGGVSVGGQPKGPTSGLELGLSRLLVKGDDIGAGKVSDTGNGFLGRATPPSKLPCFVRQQQVGH